MKNFKFIKYFTVPVKVEWENTNLNYTVNGSRKSGNFIAKNWVRAWLWGQLYTTFNSRAGVYIQRLN